MRPQQWFKNLFVFSGVLFSKEIYDPPIFLSIIIVAIAFCIISSSVYILNDIVDMEVDQLHPQKKNRPLASGQISIRVAAVFGSILVAIGCLLGLSVSVTVFSILIAYICLNIAYTLSLKNIFLLDVFCISAGFMLRIVAGTRGVGINPSKWLILCGIMITLFLAFAKRRSEIFTLDNDEEHRSVLRLYSTRYLDELITICASGVIITYSLYTMSPETVRIHQTQSLIYTVPFIIYALFRYIYLLKIGRSGSDPSRDVFRDPHLILAIIGWVLLTIWIIIYKGVITFDNDFI
jgi:4-hydroxybenzoate polyprenyltransferase